MYLVMIISGKYVYFFQHTVSFMYVGVNDLLRLMQMILKLLTL